MDEQSTDAPSTRPFVPADAASDADRARPTTQAAPAPRTDGASRIREFGLSDDGQLVEAGYGHGV